MEWLIKNKVSLTEFSKEVGIHRHILWDILTGNTIAWLADAQKIEEFTNGAITAQTLLCKSQKHPLNLKKVALKSNQK